MSICVDNNFLIVILERYKVEFRLIENHFEVLSFDNLDKIPPKSILKMLGIKNDQGHLLLVESLKIIQPIWLSIFFKHHHNFDIYNDKGRIIVPNFHLFITEILEGFL